jgi:hypothetical protein
MARSLGRTGIVASQARELGGCGQEMTSERPVWMSVGAAYQLALRLFKLVDRLVPGKQIHTESEIKAPSGRRSVGRRGEL